MGVRKLWPLRGHYTNHKRENLCIKALDDHTTVLLDDRTRQYKFHELMCLNIDELK